MDEGIELATLPSSNNNINVSQQQEQFIPPELEDIDPRFVC